ncbi:hypothetical protein PG994_011464 [Apiospora phragmitis]|uniref:Zn(2)-C6 fungal-type domain-containing protein n=1 Tax=Apiospora phragmitis TaxID=2905665 RepID=A0ABR1TSY7_9PEZI
MNSYNPRKRRYSGHEGAPAVLVSQGPHAFTSASTAQSPQASLSQQDLQILGQAALILQCPVTLLLDLNRNPPRFTTSSSPTYPEQKRLRLSSDLQPMPAHETPSSPSETSHHRPPVNPPGSARHDGFSLGVSGSRLAHYFAGISVCPPCSTCEPEGMPFPALSQFDDNERSPPLLSEKSPSSSSQAWTLPPSQPNVFPYDEANPAHLMSSYPILQPTQPTIVQPSTRREGMVYPVISSLEEFPIPAPVVRRLSQEESAAPDRENAQYPPISSFKRHESDASQYPSSVGLSSPVDEKTFSRPDPHSLGIATSYQKAPVSKRGPFKNNEVREQTAETRRIGSCIRCRMQRIRCETNPVDKQGTCLTCAKVSHGKVSRLPCLRYKITDVRLFKPGQIKGHEWTRRWQEGVADDISNWASFETRNVGVTEGYTHQPVVLRVRQFVPQEGDSLERTWVYNGVRRSVRIPAFAIVNLEEARSAYEDHLTRGVKDFCRNVVSSKHKLIWGTYAAALKAAMADETDEKQKTLLRKALRLWMAIRMTTKSTYIVGQETLGMAPDIMDETSPLRGQIPLPPVMGAQIELILIHQIQNKLRREMLDELQGILQANNHITWFTAYLVTFIFLHNVSLLCQHDAAYARKHGIKARFARENTVKEYLTGARTITLARDCWANILLAYFHYCNKGMYPFSAECKDQDLRTLAQLDAMKIKFVNVTRNIVKDQGKHWDEVRQRDAYEDDFYFISQLYEENWAPRRLI